MVQRSIASIQIHSLQVVKTLVLWLFVAERIEPSTMCRWEEGEKEQRDNERTHVCLYLQHTALEAVATGLDIFV